MSHKTTILEELATPNLATTNLASDGSNSTRSEWPDNFSWEVWRDFDAGKLHPMFAKIVESEWMARSSHSHRFTPTRWDGEFYDEDELEHSVLTPHILSSVNGALRHALQYTKLDKYIDLNLGRAGRTYYEPTGDRRFKPDWALCSPDRRDGSMYPYRYKNLLPGDTKLSNKWHSSWYSSSEQKKRNAWRDPVRQILHYCDKLERRYGFLITDQELVVIRISPQPTGEGLAETRSPRQQPPLGHSYHQSGGTDISMLSASMRDVSIHSSAASYGSGSTSDGFIIQYRAIPMENHGKGKQQLTVQLSLFYLAWMAGVGNAVPLGNYPSFDSSWPLVDGTFLHNTTGLISTKPKNLEYHDPSGERGPSWVTAGGQGGTDVLTLESVLTLEVTDVRGRLYYYYMEGSDVRRVSSSMAIYDETNQVYGYFEGLVWRPQPTPSASSKSKKDGESSKKR